MTEYTTSSGAVREHLSSQERTAHWIESSATADGQFYSPSAAPSVIDGLIPSSPPSDAGSSHSVPPKMVLRYRDGRPDEPIPRHSNTHDMSRSGSKRPDPSSHSRSHASPPSSRHRSKSGPDVPPEHTSRLGRSSSHGRDRRERPPPPSPEEIRILPSRPQNPHQYSHKSRSRSLPRDAYVPLQGEAPPPPLPPLPHYVSAKFPPTNTWHTHSQGLSGAPYDSSQNLPSPWHPYSGRSTPLQKRSPPAAVHAHSHHSQSRYAPPPIYPPPTAPGGPGIHIRHTPIPYSQYPPAGSTPFNEVARPSHPTSVHKDKRPPEKADRYEHDRSRSNKLIDSSSSSASSDTETGDPYKVQLGHEEPISPTSSSSKSPTSPQLGPVKKPFYKRLFSIADKISSSGSTKASSSSGTLLKRHPTGASGRRR